MDINISAIVSLQQGERNTYILHTRLHLSLISRVHVIRTAPTKLLARFNKAMDCLRNGTTALLIVSKTFCFICDKCQISAIYIPQHPYACDGLLIRHKMDDCGHEREPRVNWGLCGTSWGWATQFVSGLQVYSDLKLKFPIHCHSLPHIHFCHIGDVEKYHSTTFPFLSFDKKADSSLVHAVRLMVALLSDNRLEASRVSWYSDQFPWFKVVTLIIWEQV